jgi:hypothetical protein
MNGSARSPFDKLRVNGYFEGDRMEEEPKVRQFKIVVEKHTDGYVSYPLAGC